MILKLRPIAVALISTLSLQGCAHLETVKQTAKETFASDDPCSNNARNIGILLGSVAGAVIGNQVGGDKTTGTLIGLGLGGALGAFIGVEIDKRECELSKIGKKYNLDMQVTPLAISAAPTDKNSSNTNANVQNVGLSVSITDIDGKPQFNSGSGELLNNAKIHFSEIAKQYSPIEQAKLLSKDKTEQEQKTVLNELSKKRILLIGHTDDTGNTKLNAELSEKRAKAVAKLFKENGVNENQLFYQGAGETMPIADNSSETGRAKNRRVEIVDLSDEQAFQTYLTNKRPNTAFYRRGIDSVATSLEQKKITSENDASASQQDGKLIKKRKKADVSNTSNKPISTAPKAGASKVGASESSKKSNASSSKPTPTQNIDFGGIPFSQESASVNAGSVVLKQSKFSFISEAKASDLNRIETCNVDRPRNVGFVKSLKNGAAYRTAEFMPGMYGRTWYDMVGDNLVVLNKVTVLRDGLMPANNPELKVYANYNPNLKEPKPDLLLHPEVNAYQTTNGLVYRVFINGNRGLQCIDILMPMENVQSAKDGKLIYGNGAEFVAGFKPKIKN